MFNAKSLKYTFTRVEMYKENILGGDMYKIQDVNTAMDLKTGNYLPDCRTIVSSSYVDTP